MMLRMFRRMRAPLLAVSLVLVPACDADQQNGQECLKDDDCASRRCVGRICVEPGAGQPPFDSAAVTDSGSESASGDGDAEAGADAPSDAPSESAPDSASDGD